MILPERHLTRDFVQAEASRVLKAFISESPVPFKLPVNPDLIAEAHCGLTVEWEPIPEPPEIIANRKRAAANGLPTKRMQILAGIFPRSRRIVLNEDYAHAFHNNPGLERFTIAHEIGHWFLHIDQSALDVTTPSLFEGNWDEARPTNEPIICRDGEDTWIERQANWFAAALLMPQVMVLEAVAPRSICQWDARYELAAMFGVSIAAFNHRLKELGLGDVDESGRLYRSPAERAGQTRF